MGNELVTQTGIQGELARDANPCDTSDPIQNKDSHKGSECECGECGECGECDSPVNHEEIVKKLGNIISGLRTRVNLPKIPVDTEQLSERAKKRLTRRAFRNNNFIRTYPEKKSMISVLFNLNTNKETYLYTRRYGYVSLVEIPTSTLLADTDTLEGNKLYIQWMVNYANFVSKEFTAFIMRLMLINPSMNAEHMKMMLEQLRKLLDKTITEMLLDFETNPDKWWLRPENTIYVPMLPMIYEATYFIDDDQPEIDDEYGPTKLVVNGKEVSRVNFNDEYNEIGNNEHKSVRIPIGLTKTEDIDGAKLIITEDTTLVAGYDKEYEYSEVIPFVGIHNDFLTGKRNGIDKTVRFSTVTHSQFSEAETVAETPVIPGGYKHLDAEVLREHLSKFAELQK